MTVRRVLAKVVALFRDRNSERELEGEILAHLELAERDALGRGLSPEEARRTARLQFGGVEQMKEEHRDQRRAQWMETLFRDLRYGMASLVRDRGFTTVVIGVLALGIGVNVAMFTLVDAVLLKPIPFAAPDRIVRVWEAPRVGASNSTSTLDFLDWKRLSGRFEALTAETGMAVALSGDGEARRLAGKRVSSDYFKVFTAGVQLGRVFRASDDEPGSDQRVVLSYMAWQTYFGGDPNILNRRPVLDGQANEVIGVLAPGPFDRAETMVWKPLVFAPDQKVRDWHWLSVSGRLREGVTALSAQEEMRSIQVSLMDVMPVFKRNWKIMVEPLDRSLVGDTLRRSIVVAFGAVAVVLLIACANVANLLLAKGSARRKEMAIRASLGASRGRLISQLLTETLLLSVLGAGAGMALAAVLMGAAKPVLSTLIPYTADVRLDWRVLAFTAAAAVLTALLAGVLPSLQTVAVPFSQTLHQSSRGSSAAHAGLRRTLVIGEVALSLVLISCGVLMFRSLYNLQSLDTGVKTENVMTTSADLPVNAYGTPERAILFYETVSQRLAAVPGVIGVGLTSALPLEWIGAGEALMLPGVEEPVRIRYKRVDSGYFDTLGIPLLAGRGITNRDRAGAPRVVVVNEELAARINKLSKARSPVGQRVQLPVPHYVAKGALTADTEIVGVIRNERVGDAGQPNPPVAYVALAQVPQADVKLVLRTQGAASIVGVREAVRQIDPNLPLGKMATLEQVRDRTMAGTSRPAWLIGIFAAIAALLAGLGLYGVLAHAVTQRRKEIGIRMALGARPADVFSEVLGNALQMVMIGLAIGLVGAFAATRTMRSLLFGVTPLDPATLVVACVAMTLIGIMAGFIPAHRATRVNPITTLREDG